MNFNHSVRLRAGILILAVFPLASNLLALKSSGELFFQQNFSEGRYTVTDKVTLYQTRYEALKEMLPPGSVIGYVPAGKEEAYILQYTLAPIIVVENPDCEFVVSDFYDEAAVKKSYPNRRFALLKDFGDGLKLFRSQAR